MKKEIQLSSCRLTYDFCRKAVKNINLRVRDGAVSVSAPKGVPFSAVEAFLRSQESFLLQSLSRTRVSVPSLFYGAFPENGARILLWGQYHTLLLKEGKPSASWENGCVTLTFSDDKGRTKALRLLLECLLVPFNDLYERLWAAFLDFCKSEAVAPMTVNTVFRQHGERCPSWSFRAMRSRWGSCHTGKNHLTFSYRLLEKEPDAVGGVIAHELIHLLIGDHSPRFHALLDAFCPENRLLRKKLNENPKDSCI